MANPDQEALMKLLNTLLLVPLLWIAVVAQAEIVIRDDAGATIRLPAAAQRIVSLAPHITENLFTAGAGGNIVGVVEYSDYPEAAKRIRRVGDFSMPDLETIVALKPDLILAWQSGSSNATVRKLQALGLTVFQTQQDQLEDIPVSIEQFGRLAGTEAIARPAAARFRQRLAGLRNQYAEKPRVSVFYQVWHQPLLTIGGSHIISQAIHLCGGENIFSSLSGKAPAVSHEAVLAANPEAIIASGMGRETPVGLEQWRRWTRLKAAAQGNLFFVPADLVQRATLRLLDGAEQLCQHLETARKRR